jgi:hypothetical protein
MKGSKGILKGLVLLSSLALAGCFVAYRAGAFKSEPKANAVDSVQHSAEDDFIMPSTKSMELPPRQDGEAAATNGTQSRTGAEPDSPKKAVPVVQDKTIMGGSKNDGIFEPDNNDTEIMGGSKSGKIFQPTPPQNSNNNGATQTVPEDEGSFMGSSKSAPIFRPKPDTNKPKETPKSNEPPK